MPQNDPANDQINYADSTGVGITEFDSMIFEDIEEGDLFWFSENPNSDENNAYRKISDSQAQNTRTRYIINDIEYRIKVYQKT